MQRGVFWIIGAATVLLAGCVDREVYSEVPFGIRSPKLKRPETQPWLSGTDFLVVVDDSISMRDKQRVLAQSLERARAYVTRCSRPEVRDVWQPAINGVCPTGMQWEGSILSSDAASIITTSVGAGGTACPNLDQGARPIPPPTAAEIAAADGAAFGLRLARVGESGCGFEGPLEAMYRFLVDPEPPAQVATRTIEGQRVTAWEGIDATLLEQRARALRPLSQIVVIILTDEDDCSVKDQGDAWKMGAASGLSRGSAACAEPGNPCCRPCDTSEATPPANCSPLAQDPVCSKAPVWSSEDDPVNLRCWQQRRRFGRDWLFPIERYTEALTAATITTRSGRSVPNPLFAQGRTPDMVSVVLLSGVPWQNLVTASSLQNKDVMQFLTPEELVSQGVWGNILGDPSRGVSPSDPHLQESVAPRAGLPTKDGVWDPIHGHEVSWSIANELQYSCAFPLPEPRNCAGAPNCDCRAGQDAGSPLCRAPDGSYDTIQRRAKATPPPRLLEFARAMGSRAHVGSVCPRQLESSFAPGFGYSDILLQAHKLSFGSTYDLSCFSPSLPLAEDGSLSCKLLELHQGTVDCAALGRRTVSQPFIDAFVRDETNKTVCEIPAFEGDPRKPGTEAFECANALQPSLAARGYCYVDPTVGIGKPELVDACVAGNRRRIRVIPQSLPLPDTRTELICDYGQGKAR